MIGEISLPPVPHQNPFRDPESKPEWAQLTRLAGDRVAILFEDLRGRLGKIDGLQEELHYSAVLGWVPRYRLGESTLCMVRIMPGLLEATVELDHPLREKLLASPRVTAGIKMAIRSASLDESSAPVLFQLANQATVRAFANVVLFKAKFVSAR